MDKLFDDVFLAVELIERAYSAIRQDMPIQEELSTQFFTLCRKLIVCITQTIDTIVTYEKTRPIWERSFVIELDNLASKLDSNLLHEYSHKYKLLMQQCDVMVEEIRRRF